MVSIRLKLVNSFSMLSSVRPIPVSVTETTRFTPYSCTERDTVSVTLPFSVNLIALVIRLRMICLMRSSSPSSPMGDIRIYVYQDRDIL